VPVGANLPGEGGLLPDLGKESGFVALRRSGQADADLTTGSQLDLPFWWCKLLEAPLGRIHSTHMEADRQGGS
jgi:hypothetical protein